MLFVVAGLQKVSQLGAKCGIADEVVLVSGPVKVKDESLSGLSLCLSTKSVFRLLRVANPIYHSTLRAAELQYL